MLKRYNSLLLAFVFVITAVAGRCGYIALSKSYTVSDSYNSYTVSVGELYTSIYDRCGVRINNSKTERIAVIPPDENALAELNKLFEGEEAAEISNEHAKSYPIKKAVSKKANTKYIYQFDRIIYNPENMPAENLISKDYGGLEQYVERKIGELSVNFATDARGRLLEGDSVTVNNDNYDSVEGVIISLDTDIQKIAQEASKNIKKGAVVILDVETSQVLASVSCGEDYLNRAILPYSVGSVFKLAVCACALENNIDLIYNCNSKIKVGDTVFSCQNNHSHGIQNMKKALANSCNCYFVNLALKLGEEKIYETAEKLGFGEDFKLFDGWNVSSGVFPSLDELRASRGQLALIGFGQGKLSDSPMHFASLVACIANGGNYNSPTLSLEERKENNVLSKKTCSLLREYMKNVVDNGTGGNASYKNSTAGKTATAQSGRYVDGKEILNTWFAGFYPYSNPKYAIVVMQEDGTSGSENCCPVFRTIVEKLDNL